MGIADCCRRRVWMGDRETWQRYATRAQCWLVSWLAAQRGTTYRQRAFRTRVPPILALPYTLRGGETLTAAMGDNNR